MHIFSPGHVELDQTIWALNILAFNTKNWKTGFHHENAENDGEYKDNYTNMDLIKFLGPYKI